MAASDSEQESAQDSSDSDENQEDYGDVHRMVLQGFMAHGLLGPAAVKGLFKTAWKRCSIPVPPNTEFTLIAKAVKEINSKISRFNFGIKSASCEFTGKLSYLFTITADSQLMRLQTYFSKVEVELFSKGMEMMMTESDDFTIGAANFVNLALGMEGKVNIGQAEKVMDKMLAYNYFTKNFLDAEKVDYNLTLGIRAIVEMEPVISESYPDALTHCHLCRKIMLHGYTCPKCPYVLHIYCYKKYIQNTKECPDCHQAWIREDNMVRRKYDNKVNIKDEEIKPEQLDETPDPTAAAEEDMDTQPTPRPRTVSVNGSKRKTGGIDSDESTDEFDY